MSLRTAAEEQYRSGQFDRWPLYRLRSLAYPAASRRDLRLDFLRGLAISAMVVDHIGGDTFLTTLSGGNRWIVSAAEFFVFLAGLVLGVVYRSRTERAGIAETTRKLLQRALTLYRASVGMALGFAALYLATDLRLWLDRAGGIGEMPTVEALVGILTLHHSYHGSDVLVMYTLMLALSPVVFYLLSRGMTLPLLAGSAAIWAIYQAFPQQASVPWTVTGSSFQVAPWQLLLVMGMVTGFHKKGIFQWLCSGSRSCRLVILAAALGICALASTHELFGQRPLLTPLGETSYAILFDKVGLGPGRLLAFLCVAILAYSLVTGLWVPLYRALGWLIIPLGQKSLYVYVAHLFVLVAIYNVVSLMPWESPDVVNLSAQLAGLGICWLLVRCQLGCFIVPQHGPHHSVE